MKHNKHEDIIKDYQLWIECVLYTKLQALKLLDEKRLNPYQKIEVQQQVKDIFLVDGFVLQTDLSSGHFHCLRPNQTRASRVEELDSISESKNPGNAPDINWLLELNKFKPMVLKRSITDIKQSDFEFMLNQSGRIETDDGKNINCGCQMGSTCSIF